jgi:hypothetical protein
MNPSMWSRPDQSRYYAGMARAERTDEQLRTERAVIAKSGRDSDSREGQQSERVTRPATAPVLEWNDDRLRERDAKRLRADDEFWQWYIGTLEDRGKCLCPSCYAKVEKFGQYCPQCTF